MQDDLVKVERLSMDAAGGQVRLDGTTVRLGPVDKPWDLKLAVKSLDLAQALTFGGKGKAFAGVFDGNIALAGKGTTLAAVEKTLDGKIDGNLKNGAFLGADLVAAVAGPLAKALPFATKALGGTGHTPLGENVGISLTVDNGVAKLNKPLTVQLPQAGVTLGGGVGLSGALALAGTVALTPETIKTLTGGKVTPSEAIPVALSLSGPAWAPQNLRAGHQAGRAHHRQARGRERPQGTGRRVGHRQGRGRTARRRAGGLGRGGHRTAGDGRRAEGPVRRREAAAGGGRGRPEAAPGTVRKVSAGAPSGCS